jgi:ankyrin repeat protein
LELSLATERTQGNILLKPNGALINYILDLFDSTPTTNSSSRDLKSLINHPLSFTAKRKPRFTYWDDHFQRTGIDCSKFIGQTPFLLACSLLGNERELLEKFINLGANVNIRDAEGVNDAITILLHQGIELPPWAKEQYSNWERTVSKSRTLLHLVCESNGRYIANTKILLEKAKHLLDQKDLEGITPLMIACK